MLRGTGTGSTSATYRSVVKKPSTPPERTRRTPMTRADGPNCSLAAAIASSRVAASTDRNGTAHDSQRLDLGCAGDLREGDHRQAREDLPDQPGQSRPDLRRAHQHRRDARPLGLLEHPAAPGHQSVDLAGVQGEDDSAVRGPDGLE